VDIHFAEDGWLRNKLKKYLNLQTGVLEKYNIPKSLLREHCFCKLFYMHTFCRVHIDPNDLTDTGFLQECVYLYNMDNTCCGVLNWGEYGKTWFLRYHIE
jgi:hypothetical protein